MSQRPEPTRRLPPQARTLWRLEGAMGSAFLAVLAVAGLSVAGAPPWVDGLVAAVVLVNAVAQVVIVPTLRWRRWRFEIRDEEIDLRRGAFTMTRTLVPVARVQHVDTSQGVLERALSVSSVIFHTAAGTSQIPALRDRDAAEVRDRIATLARTPDEL